MNSRGHYIGQHWIQEGERPFQSYNPATGTLLWEGLSATPDTVQRAVQAARDAFTRWSLTPVLDRIAICLQFQALVKEQKNRLAARLTEEHGKPLWEAALEVDSLIAKTDISITAYHERTGMRESPLGTSASTLTHRPHGVVAVFSPFNFPYHLAHGHIIPALIAGNTVVLKPSELTPRCSEDLVALWQEAGLPPGVLNLIQGDAATGASLCDNPIQGVFFTGSVATGRAIHRLFAGKPEVILALEMGGNNPLLVFDVADHEAAAYQIIQSAFITSGQRCTAARRLILPKTAEGDSILETLIHQIKTLIIGPGDGQPEPFMGPMISAKAAEAVLAFESQLLALGGRSLLRSQSLPPGFLSPLLVEVSGINTPDHECFGPLLQIIRVTDLSEGIAIANQTQFGLSAGLFSDNSAYFDAFHEKIRAGIINWNRPLTGAASSAPFGGIGLSGNLRPSAYYAADYCAYPVAGLIGRHVELPTVRRGFS